MIIILYVIVYETTPLPRLTSDEFPFDPPLVDDSLRFPLFRPIAEKPFSPVAKNNNA